AGRLLRGRSRASGENQLRAVLRRQGLRPLALQPVAVRRVRALDRRELASLTRQLAVLLGAGLPLLQALQMLARSQARPAVQHLLENLHADLQQGLSLAAAMRRQRPTFSERYLALVEAGELSGRLEQLLERLARYLEQTEALARRLRGALLYPSVVLAVAVGVVALIMVAVVPAFENTFASFGAQLPWATQWVIAASRWLLQWGSAVLLLVLALALVARQAWVRSPMLVQRVDAAVLALPLWGALLRQAAQVRWSRTLATLLGAGMPLADALQAVRGASGYLAYAQATGQVRDEVMRGSSLHAALAPSALFSPLLQQMCAVGEASGTLEHMLEKAADFHDSELSERLEQLTGLIEPATIVIMGLLVGGLVMALYLPVFQMGQIV
ncbi:MAG: type II secretion system F family protein, partial [Betaproteobacteria bacterium]